MGRCEASVRIQGVMDLAVESIASALDTQQSERKSNPFEKSLLNSFGCRETYPILGHIR